MPRLYTRRETQLKKNKKNINNFKQLNIMKRIFLTCVAVIVATIAIKAQQIAVVSPSPEDATTLYTDLNLAIKGAANGSTIYLSGGGFQINDTTRITKKLTIIGIGHRPDNDNADGNTIVSGNLQFEEGSDNSVLMGVYLSGHVYLGTGAKAVNTVLVQYCNINTVQVRNGNCQNIRINRNYLREGSNGGNSTINFTNNVLRSIGSVNGGVIDHNVITGGSSASNSRVTNNILIGSFSASNGVFNNNMATSSVGDSCVIVDSWENVLQNYSDGISPNKNYALKGDTGKNAATDGTDIGIYGGTGFKDSALPPMPRITAKQIANQTDENGQLNAQIIIKTE
jgi:hypothetical protein